MSARHPETQATITKNRSLKKINDAFSTIQKIATYQIPIPPTPLPVAGGGISVGSGTQFPILYPIGEIGNVSGNVTVNLANQTLHYQKFNINAAGVTTFSFDGLLLNKAIIFTLDVTIGVAGVTAVNWPANLFNIPTLPITNGSRYVLYISGFRDGTEERYEVVGSSIPSGGGSNLWSNIVIDTDKDMLGFGLSDLSFLSLKGSAGTQHSDFGVNSNYSVYDFIDTVNTNIGHVFQINSLGYFQIIHNTAALPYTDFLYAQVNFDMNNFSLYNINELDFHSSGQPINIKTSGDGKVFDFYNEGIPSISISRADVGLSGAVLEVFGGSSNGADIKIVSTQDPALNNMPLGGYTWDGNNNSLTQISYASFFGIARNVGAGAEVGEVSLFVYNGAAISPFSPGPQEMARISQKSGSAGWDFRGQQLFGVQSLQFNYFVGSTLTPASSFTDDGSRLFCNLTGTEFFRLQQTGTPYLDFTTTEIIPQHNITAGISDVQLGDSTHVFQTTFSKTYHVQNNNIVISNDGSNNLIFSLLSAKNISFEFPSALGFQIDSSSGLVGMSGPIFGLSFNQGSHAGTITKTSGNPLEIACTDLIQIDNHLIPQNSNTQTIGTSTVPFFSAEFLNFNLIPSASSSIFWKTQFNANYAHDVLNDTTNTNIGFNWQITSASGSKFMMQLVHNTGNDPIDFMYLQVPLWLSAPSSGNGQNSYIQFEEITDPTTPTTDFARLYIKDNGAGKSALVIKWESGTVTTIATEP